jgi:hypothetical protein
MFSTCANPECRVSFDYHEGRFFRFHKSHLPGEAPANTHSVQHFWLCGKCSKEFMLEYEETKGVEMLHRLEMRGEFESSRSIAAA